MYPGRGSAINKTSTQCVQCGEPLGQSKRKINRRALYRQEVKLMIGGYQLLWINYDGEIESVM